MGFVIAGIAAFFLFVLFLIAADLSVATSSRDQGVWGWRVFRKLGILKLLQASRKRAARRQDAARKREAERNQN